MWEWIDVMQVIGSWGWTCIWAPTAYETLSSWAQESWGSGAGGDQRWHTSSCQSSLRRGEVVVLLSINTLLTICWQDFYVHFWKALTHPGCITRWQNLCTCEELLKDPSCSLVILISIITWHSEKDRWAPLCMVDDELMESMDNLQPVTSTEQHSMKHRDVGTRLTIHATPHISALIPHFTPSTASREQYHCIWILSMKWCSVQVANGTSA